MADLEDVFVGEEGEGFVFACVSGQTSENMGQFSQDLYVLLVAEEINQFRHDFLVTDDDSSRVPIAAEVGDQPTPVPPNLYTLTHE